MKYLEEKTSNVSILVENQFPSFVRDTNEKFINFISSYYESQEGKYQPLDIASNLIDYYNIGYYRSSRLIEYTKLIESGNLTDTAKTITVESTIGFPETNGYIKIDDEIIFYRNRTTTQFLECERGASALVLNSIPKSNLYLTSSTADEHKNLVSVKNIAYDYANEFLSRIKSELSPLIPEVLDESLDLSSFIKNIKSFYSSKGSLNSHRILFRILFNDRKFNFKIKNRGVGAKLKINSSRSYLLQAGVGIQDGGSGYDDRKDSNNKLINPPIVDILGSGIGSIDLTTQIRKNKTAIIEVTDINSDGTITAVSVVDKGEGYQGAVTARVRPSNFKEDEIVQNISGTGSGRVEYYDTYTDELILYDVVGYFLPNEEIYSDSGEKARAFISQSFISPSNNRSGLRIDGEEQQIEFPKDYTFKTSNSSFSDKKTIKCRLIDGYFLKDDKLPEVITLKQNADPVFGVPGVDIEIDNSVTLSKNIFAFDITTNSDINKIFLPPSTVITKQIDGVTSSTTNFVLTVDEVTRFPITNGIVSINGKEILYKYRSAHQLFDCSYSGSGTINFNVKDEVISVARLKENTPWSTATNFSIGDYVFHGENLYVSKNSGVSGTTAPTHTDGKEYDGTIVNSNPILWEYAGKNRLDHTFYFDYNNSLLTNPKFQLLGLPGDIVIEEGGSLHSETTYSFARFDSPNVEAFSFTTPEISDRLSSLLATNTNRTRDSITETSSSTTQETNNIKSLPSYQSLTGYSSQYDFQEYIYVAGSGIPRWWDKIVDLNTVLSVDDKKKVAFTNQRLLTRWKKSSLVSETQAVGVGRTNKKLIGLNLDAVQINSYKGNTVSYGYIKNFYIGDGGDYPVLYTEDSNGFGYTEDPAGLPVFKLSDSLTVGSANNLIKISSSLRSIDFNKLAIAWSSTDYLKGFSTRPNISVINNNLQIKQLFSSYTGLNVSTKIITKTNHKFDTALKVTFKVTSGEDSFITLRNNTEYFVRKVDDDKFTLHRTKSEALLNSNPVSLSYLTPALSNPKFEFISEQLNPSYFREAKVELSYKNGIIDNIIIKDSGEGYISLPTIRISGGGKVNGSNEWHVDVPFSLYSDRIVDFRGPLVSYFNFYKDNYNELEVRSSSSANDGFVDIPATFDIAPSVEVEFGGGARAIAYTSSGAVTSISLIKGGSGYTFPPVVTIVGGGGSGAVVTSTISNGKVNGFIIVNGGSGYTLAPKVEITSSETRKSLISSKLNEWTFNLVRQLNKLDRIDSYGGYVYDDSDAIPPKSINEKNFRLIDYRNDFPKDLDEKQYYLLQNTKKISALYLKEKAPAAVITAAETALGKLVSNMTDDEILTSFIMHTLPLGVSYDGIPTYASGRILELRNKPLVIDPTDAKYVTQFTTTKSRYNLKYKEVSSGTTGAITLNTTNGTKYVTLSRTGGPSISDYPIGTFIEDYEYNEGDDNDLDEHNGRFSITPEFPTGRYCYFTTLESYDPITNALVESGSASNDNIGFNGFPYFVGDTFASTYDDYMNNRCRRNDKIPSVFTRSFEKDIDPIIVNGITIFTGLDHNDEYPKEDSSLVKTIAKTTAISPGSVDSVIIENKGDNYRVGDRLVVDNNLTNGSGFSAIVSKVSGKPISKIVASADGLLSTFTTDLVHDLSINDFVYFDYNQGSDNIQINLLDNYLGKPETTSRVILIDDILLDDSASDVDTYKDFEFYEINVNFKYTYQLNIPTGAEFLLTYDLEKTNEFFTLEKSPTNSVVINALNIPNRLYLHIGSRIYQINKTRDYFGIQKVISTSLKTFTIQSLESSKGYEIENISYSAKSYGARGPIEEISITSAGSGYKKLPTITGLIKKGTENTEAGNGKAIIQSNSGTIGKLKKLSYSSVGSSITANSNVNHYLNIPSTAKIINNFEIYGVEIVDGGDKYFDTDTILVNGETGLARLKLNVYLGTITSVSVLDGGMNFNEEPTLTVTTKTGKNAILKAKLRRKNLFPKQILTGTVNSLLFPVSINIDVVNYDSRSSSLEFNENSGQFKDGDIIYVEGKKYGKIQSIRRSKAYSKVRSYSQLQIDSPNISGRTSESLQKITDSNYYQDWSYSLTSSRDTKEWKYQQNINTHPAGFKQFGKKLIERRKSFFKNPLDVFKSSVIFSTKISRTLDLSLKLSPCGTQRLFLSNASGFTTGGYITGTVSEAVGRIKEVTESSLIVEVYNNNKSFVLGEILVQVDKKFAFGISDATNKSFNFWNGIFQEPGESYEISENPTSYIPRYNVDNSDEIVLYTIDTSFVKLDNQVLNANETSFSFSLEKSSYPITSSILDEFIISIGGVVQNPANLTVSANAVETSQSVSNDSNVIAVRHTNLSSLTFTGSGTTYTITQTPTSNCQLLIFRTGIFQTQLLTDFTVTGNQIVFSESIPSNEIFGWYYDGNITCQKLDSSTFNQNKILKQLPCEKTKFLEKIESNAVKKPESLYEIRKKYIDGTIVPVSSTKVEGFDTKFIYTSPSHSDSYVEVIDAISLDGSTQSFSLETNGETYTPRNGEESLIVYIDNDILDHDQYSVSGSTINFSQTYASTKKCTILDFVSDYVSNTNSQNCAILDRINVLQNGSRTTFNLSDRGVPKYVRNVGDIFKIKNNKLERPDSQTQSVNNNKITFVAPPTNSDDISLIYFNRQLQPVSTNNVMFDDLYCFDGVRTSFPFAVDGAVFNYTSTTNLHLYMSRNGVIQKPGVDYVLAENSNTGTWQINFSEAPTVDEEGKIFAWFSYGGNLQRNQRLDFGNYVDGIQKEFSITQNYNASNLIQENNLVVFRNGVHQVYDIDYTVNGTVNPTIVFDVAPQQVGDYIYMLNLKKSGLGTFTQSDISQVNSNTLSVYVNFTANDFIIFVNGVKQNPNSAYTVSGPVSGTYTFNFTDNVSKTNDNVSIYAYNGSDATMFVQCDEITVSNTSTNSYNLTSGGSAVTNIPNVNGLLVSIDGVVQEPGISYTLSGSTITFVNPSFELNDKIDIITIGNDNVYVDFIDDNYAKLTQTKNGVQIKPTRYKLSWVNRLDPTDKYEPYNNSLGYDPAHILVMRNSVVQNPTEDYTIGQGFIEFTTNVIESDDIYLLYVYGREELSFTQSGSTSSTKTYTLSSALSGSQDDDIILFADGVPRFKRRGDFTVTNNDTIVLQHTDGFDPTQVFITKYPSLILLDDFENCPNGTKTIFNIYFNQNNWSVNEVDENADILISKNGIVLNPGAEYNLISNDRQVEFTTPPVLSDTFFFVKMNDNKLKSLTNVSGNTYNLSDTYSSNYDKEGLVIFSNNVWKFAENGDFTWDDNNTITLSTAHTTGSLFAIKFNGLFHLLDEIHTPFDGSRNTFNMFDGEENFMPPGTVSDDSTPDPTSLLVTKNGELLEPGHQFTLTGDNESQIQFTTSPSSSDIISVRSVGMFDKLDTIASGSGTVFPLTKSSDVYYPNAHIERPRELENQIIIIKDGEVQSPLYDFYIDNNNVVFINSVSGSRLSFLDFRGTAANVKVFSRLNQVSVGDELYISGESSPRTITKINSPTVLETASYTDNSPSGFVATTNYSDGIVSGFTMTDGGGYYENPVVIRTKGTGSSAKAVARVKTLIGENVVDASSIELQYPGRNVYNDQTAIATVYATSYKKQPIHKSEVRKATKLNTALTNSSTTVVLGNATGLSSNPPVVTVTSNSGTVAQINNVKVFNGKIIDMEILSGGSSMDDRDVAIAVTGGGGSGCVLEPVLNVSGTLTGVNIKNPGTGYDSHRVIILNGTDEKEEVIEYTEIISNTLIGITRGVAGTSASSHQTTGTSVYFDNYL